VSRYSVDAFFDNDLIRTSRMFLKSSRGSFGLCITSSLDADRQMALAARGGLYTLNPVDP
jgi:hypothetical protein